VNSAILTKPGRLDDDERHEMNQHTTYGYQILSRSDRLQMAAEIAHAHHEQWNGSGYPQGLRGEQIPISARILGIADIYDALRSERAYKPAFSDDKTFQILTVGDDRLDPTKHFDPKLLEVFKKYHGEFDQIRKRLED
jgi:HD-GYP domain-containing protein (c-di-GMP phosphodiesterase class II)